MNEAPRHVNIWWENIPYSIERELKGLQAEMNLADLRDKACVMGRGNKLEHGSTWHWRGG